MQPDYKFLFLDWETFYDSKSGYTLKKISRTEYIRSPQFKPHGLGFRWLGEKSQWITYADIPAWIKTVDWTKTALVAQDTKFDGAILAWIYGICPALYMDTLSMARAIIGSKTPGHSLAVIAKYLKLGTKGDMKTDGIRDLSPEQEAELATYCLTDVDLCHDEFLALLPDFPGNQFQVVDWSIRCFVKPILTLNTARLEKAVAEEKERRNTIFADIGIEKAVFSSNKKFSELLQSKGFEVPQKTSPRTSKQIPALALGDPEFLEMLDSQDQELANLCEARVAAKSNLLETRSVKFHQISKTGPWPFDINFSGAIQTHRFSGGNGAGGNPQNLKRKGPLRESVTAPKGHKLIVIDLAAIELRIVGWLAKEFKITGIISGGGDPYSDFATQIYKRLITKENKDERQYGKTAVLGLGYNMGAEKFKKTTKTQIGKDIDDRESWRVVSLYRNYYSAVPRLWQTLDTYIPYIAEKRSGRFHFAPFLKYENGTIILPSGLKLQYPDLRQAADGDWVYTAHRARRKTIDDVNIYGGKLLENISQALAGEICKTAIDRIEDKGIHVCGQVHDEMLIVALEDKAEDVAELALAETVKPISWWPDIKIGAEVGIGDNWQHAKP